MTMSNTARTDPGMTELLGLTALSRSKLHTSREIMNEIHKLQIKRRNLLKEINALQDINLPPAAEAHSKGWFASFGPFLQARLPREIRDLIYHYLILSCDEDNQNDWFGGLNTIEISTRSSPEKTECDTCWYHPVYHVRSMYQTIVSPDYFDPATRSEIAQEIYKANTFTLCTPDILSRFLAVDVFGTDCYPSDHIRRLRIRVQHDIIVEECASEAWNQADILPTDESGEVVVPGSSPNSSFASLLADLSRLKCRRGAEVTIELTKRKRFVTQPFLFILGVLVYRLRDEGFVVRVEQKGKKSYQKLPKAGVKLYEWPGWDWTHVFDGTKQEWLVKAEKGALYKDFEHR